MEPDVTKEADFGAMVGAVLVCPHKSSPTCNGKVYDYFIASEVVTRSLVEVYVDDDACVATHALAGLRFHSTGVDIRRLSYAAAFWAFFIT